MTLSDEALVQLGNVTTEPVQEQNVSTPSVESKYDFSVTLKDIAELANIFL